MRTFLVIGLCTLALLGFPLVRAHWHKNQVVYNSEGVALEGYDVVSYFQESGVLRGSTDFRATHKSLSYLFSNQANLDKFLQDPERYLPQYGGWCATAMATGRRVRPVPSNYVISGDKVYLFYEFMGINPMKKWVASEASYKADADPAYRQLSASAASE